MCTELFTMWHLCQYSMFTLNYAYNFSFYYCLGIWLSFLSHPLISEDEVSVVKYTLLQNLTQDSATLTGWRRAKRSGEGKMIALYGLGIFSLRYQSVIFLLLFSIKSRFLGEIGVWKLRSALLPRPKSGIQLHFLCVQGERDCSQEIFRGIAEFSFFFTSGLSPATGLWKKVWVESPTVMSDSVKILNIYILASYG